MSKRSVFREAWSPEMTSQSFPVSCLYSCGFVPHRKWNLTLLVHQNTGKENRYRNFFLLYLPVHWGDLRCSLINWSYLQRKHLFLFCIFRYIVDSVGNWINLRVYDTDLTCGEKRMIHNASTMTRARFILDSCNTRAISHFINKSMCALWLVNQLWVLGPVNSCKNCTSSKLLYKSNRLGGW